MHLIAMIRVVYTFISLESFYVHSTVLSSSNFVYLNHGYFGWVFVTYFQTL